MKLINLNAFVPKRVITLLAVCLLMIVPAFGQTGGDYILTSSTIGGGGTSAGGNYSLSGIVGQPEAGWMSGGDYELLGGFLPGPENNPPVANAGDDQTVEQESYDGTEVTLDGSGSTDPDSTPGTNDDIVSFDWFESDTFLGSGETINYTFPLGTHTVTLVVTDSYGQTDDDEVIIIVQDTTPPVITLNGSATVVLECGVDSYTEEGATATDLCDPDVPVVIGGDTVDPSTCGTYVVTYDANDASCNPAEQVTRSVIVHDTTPPVITLNGSSTVVLECGVDSYIEEGATATDICDPDVPVVIGGDTVDPSTCGTYVVTYDATDSWGNEAVQVTRTVNVVDMTAPTINSISADPDVLWSPNHKMVEVTVTVDAEDLCDPPSVCQIVDVTSNEPINGPGNGNTEPDWEITGDLTVKLRTERAGGGTGRVYSIHIECTDASGNTATATAEVTVPHDQGKGKK